MTAHDEDKEDNLCYAKDLSANDTEEHFPCVCHVVDVRVLGLELSNDVAGVGSGHP